MKGKIKKTLKSLGKFLGVILVIFIIVSIVKFLNIGGIFSSKITAYPVLCKDIPVSGECENPDYILGKMTYKISTSKKEVIYWREDSPLETLINCMIVDKMNWSCEYNDKSAKLGFSDGKFWETRLQPSILEEEFNRTYYASRTEYLLVVCKNDISCLLFLNLLN